MKVLLVNPQPTRFFKSATCPLGILSIATYLNGQGHVVKISDRESIKSYSQVLKKFKPDVVGISVISNKSIVEAMSFSAAAHKSSIPVVWGGALASMIYETILKSGYADYVIIGEGELTWKELLDSFADIKPLEEVDGLAYVCSGKIKVNKDREFANLADFPVLDWSLVNPEDYFQSLLAAKKMLYLYSAKGCPSECTFCFNKGLNRCVYRKRPLGYCIEEIQYLTKNTELDGVHFADELWCRNKKEMTENCDMIKNAGLNIVWGCNARIGIYSKEDFEYMFRAGCRWIFFGVESGSERIHLEIKKRIPLDKVEETVKNCTGSGIVAVTSFILGFPGETREDIKKTVELAKRIPEAMYDFNLFFPIPGSEMCDKLISEGKYTLPKTLEGFSEILPTEKLQLNFSEVPIREIKVIRAYFMWSSFLRKNTSSGSKHYEFTKKAIKDAVKGLFGHGARNFVVTLFFSASIFLGIVFNLVFFPNIRKYYGLDRSI